MKPSTVAGFLFLWLRMGCVSGGEKVEQSPSLSVQQGSKAVINCNYSNSASDYFPWYKKEPGKSLQLIIYIRSPKPQEQKERYKVLLNENEKQLSLHIADTQPGDSAVYFCAESRPNNYKLTFGAGTRVTVRANIKDPKPAVYQLTKSKSSNKTVCLVTDFSSDKNIRNKSYVDITNTTVLDMKSTESKSNGILAWDKTASFDCSDIFNAIFYPSSDLPCNAALVQENFQTDWNLNFQNLLVITFRILFLKVTGFNLLMTLRLWSC